MSALTKISINWEAHLEALPLPTWIIGQDTEQRSQEGFQGYDRAALAKGQLFLNQACRDLLGLTSQDAPGAASWLRYIHPEDQQACLVAWNDFVSGRQARFGKTLRWIRPKDKSTISVVVRAQRLLCGDIQGWLRPALAEQALSRLEELARGRG